MAALISCHQFLTSPRLKAWLKEQWIHLKSYETRVGELKSVVENLKKVRDIIQHKVDEEEHHHGREIVAEVKQWIERVDQLISEYDDFNGDDTCHELAVFDLLNSGYLPKPGIRYHQSRKAGTITKKANGLLQTAKFDTFSYWPGPASMAAFFSNVGYESFPSRKETMRKIIEELEKPSVRMIGLYGLSGVGKTTLVKEVVKEALEAKMFDVVTMASVTRNPDIRKIQGQIVDMLGLTLDEESDNARAAHIQKILKNEKNSTLIILDDLWGKLDFNCLGIPYEIDNVEEGKSLNADGLENVHEAKHSSRSSSINNMRKTFVALNSNRVKTEETLSKYKGCKILIISESKHVLFSQMEGKANSIFSIEVLKEKEADMLFKKTAGIGDDNFEFEKLAAKIANKCKGLPMSIVTTARALKNQSRSVWEDINRKLEWQKSTGGPEFSTKMSYDLLEDEELKYAFLLCARMGHDALIMDLVKQCIGLGFLEGIYTVRETRDRVHALVAKLKESGLLSDSYSRDQFTMQNIVRSAALSIAYKENNLFTRTKGKIDEWPDKLERYASISFHHCDFIEGFPGTINYPRLRVFHVNNSDPHLKIPKNFFKGMKELKVLILTGIRLCLSDSSISSLIELRMLCLEHCMLDKELSIIGKLKKLRILSFSGSDIEKLPVELEQLKRLQIFDISDCSKLKEIPSGVISSLVSLEELYMRNTLIQWEVEEHTHNTKNASLSELKHLNQLTTLDIQIPEVSYLPKNLFFDKLDSYRIIIGDLTAYLESDFKMPEKYETLRFLAIRLKGGFDIHSLKGIKMLFERVENLFLGELNIVHPEDNIVHDIFYRLNLKGFPYLKNLSIVDNSTIQYLIHPEDRDRKHPEKVFPKLESLYLYNLKKMDTICSCQLSEPSFAKLKVIKINLCDQLENVFSISLVRLLTVLETIEVSECNSLKEIVHVEQSNTNEIKLLKFPELRFVKLQSLSNFIGFYPIQSRDGDEKEIFHEKVEVSKLERLELSSVPIVLIWSDRSSQRSSFQNLTHLDVNGCWKLKYLLSFSMAKSLACLQSLFVSECEKMRSIFPLEQDSHQKMKGVIFPKLKNIKLSSMKSLSQMWNSKLPSNSFSKLDTLIIEECDKLVNVFPCYIGGRIFDSLCNLRVTDCRSMQAIFNMLEQVGDLANLQDVHLETLPKLEHVWKFIEDQGRILNLNNLQKILVQSCDSLENIFPFSVANTLSNLECLVVRKCLALREIVAKKEAPNTDAANLDPSFNFPKLSSIKLTYLPQLRNFYPGAYKLFCPTLNDLSIELCDMLQPFYKETEDAQRNFVFFPEKVINKLKSLQIESRHAESQSSYMGGGNHRRDNLEELCLSRLKDTEILYSFLHRNPNLKSLTLNYCFFEEIVALKKLTEIEKLGVVPNLKSLKLIDLHELKEIGFDVGIILERIEFLILKNCSRIITVVPSSVSLTHLTNLEVVNCQGLKNLMSPSTAKSLGQLNTMKVIKCEALREIVEKGENAGKVVFKQLKTLELVSLENLKSFCSSDSCEFVFPSLEKLVVSACYNMENFSEKVTSTPILQNIYVVHGKEKKRCCWEGDLNATIQKIFKEKKFFEGMDEIKFSEHPELLQAWQGDVDLQHIHSWFYGLKTLKLEKCVTQPCALPFNVLPYLKNLKELEVHDCKNVKVIFEMNVREGAETTLQLQKLTLKALPELIHVWGMNGKGTNGFQNLQEVFVDGCGKLQTMFPVAVAKILKKLEKLKIEHCHRLLQIVGKEEDTAEGITQKFSFPCLTSVHLYDLCELIYFYPEPFTLECPALYALLVLDCLRLKLFESANRQSLFMDIKDISNFEGLALDWEHTSLLRSNLGELTGYLESLKNVDLFFDVDENKKPFFPIEILQKAPNLNRLGIQYCRSLEMFHIQIPEIAAWRMLTQLKDLVLVKVRKLQSIEDSPWLNIICDKIHKFKVLRCPDLTTIVYSTFTVSFSFLKDLYVSECNGLQYLFTSSTAKMLVHLEHISLWNCESIKEIVAKEQDETASGGIKLERLYRIGLYWLPSLKCFYSGNDTLQLPSLIHLDLCVCRKMETFSKGSIIANSFRGIQASDNIYDDLVFYNDLNSSVKKVFLGQFLEVAKSQCPPNYTDTLEWLSDLGNMEVTECLQPYVIPSYILPYLKDLIELQVLNSDQVEVIFYMDDTEIIETTSELKTLTLQELPNLVSVWGKNRQGVLIFGNLQEIVVSDCQSLQSLIPASLAKNLEKLELKSCPRLQEIVEKEEDTAENVTEKFVFPRLKTLDLDCLPHLTCFHPQTFTLELPALTKLSVLGCDELELFQSANSMGEGEGTSTSINRQPLISDQVLFNLKELILDWKHISTLNLWLESEQFTEGLKYLKYISLSFFVADENEKPMLPIKILQKAPNLAHLAIGSCKSPEIFLAQTPKIGEDGMLGQLKILTLDKVSALESMESEGSSWLNTICDKLHELTVVSCFRLTTLVHTVSFSCLKRVSISKCSVLQYLFTSAAAKKLMNLEEIVVEECESLKEIVAKEGEEDEHKGEGEDKDKYENEITFEKLKILTLNSLPKFESFYRGSSTLNFPSLKEVGFTKCCSTKLFRPGDKRPAELIVTIDKAPNSAIMQQLEEAADCLN